MSDKLKWACIVILAIFILYLGNQVKTLQRWNDAEEIAIDNHSKLIEALHSWNGVEKIAIEHLSESISNLELAELQNSELIKLYHERMKLTEEIQDIIMRRLGMK